jgi:tRNA(fMet)-specific endonuclease VapC
MKRYLLDTGTMGHFIDHRHGVDLRVCDARQLGARIGTCFPVIGELFAGVELSASREKNLPRLRRALTHLVCWPFDRAAAEEFGRVFAELRRAGRPMQLVDMQIAAVARTGHIHPSSFRWTERPTGVIEFRRWSAAAASGPESK